MDASNLSDDDNWLPFGSEDIPSDDEPHMDSDLPSDDEPEDDSRFDEIPQIEESLPPEEKKPKSVKAQKVPIDKDQQLVDRYLDDLFPKRSTKTNYKGPTFPAPKRSGSKKQKSATPEEVAKHMVLILKIEKYRTSPRYAECLARYRLPLQDADDMSIQELEQLLIRIGVVINNQRAGSNALGTGILVGASVAEKSAFLNRFANLQGYSSSLAQNDEFNDLCEQISINYSIMDNIRPELRLAMVLGKHAITVNGMNIMKAQMGAGGGGGGPPQANQPSIASAPVPSIGISMGSTSSPTKRVYQDPIYDL